MSGVFGIIPFQSIELVEPAIHHPVSDAVVERGIPRLGEVGDHPIGVPLRQAHEGGALQHVAPVAPEHHLIDDHVCDAGADLPIEQGVVPFEIHEDLGAHDAGEAADVLLAIHPSDSDVALAEIGERVVDDELQAFVQGEIELLLKFLLVSHCGLRHVPGHIASFLVEENLHVLEPVLLPEEFLVLHAVLPILLLRSRIELREGQRRTAHHQEQGDAAAEREAEKGEHRLKLALGRPHPSAMVRISGFSGHAESFQVHLQPVPGEYVRDPRRQGGHRGGSRLLE